VQPDSISHPAFFQMDKYRKKKRKKGLHNMGKNQKRKSRREEIRVAKKLWGEEEPAPIHSYIQATSSWRVYHYLDGTKRDCKLFSWIDYGV